MSREWGAEREGELWPVPGLELISTLIIFSFVAFVFVWVRIIKK